MQKLVESSGTGCEERVLGKKVHLKREKKSDYKQRASSIIDELYNTERNYVKRLRILLRVVMTKLFSNSFSFFSRFMHLL